MAKTANSRSLLPRPSRHLSPQEGDELVVDYLHHLLSGRKAAEHFPPGGLFANGVEKAPGHLKVHIGFQQRTANLA